MLLNGKPVNPDRLKGLALTNYGHFTSMRVDNHRVRGLDLHLDRLVNDCRAVFGSELDRDHLTTLIRQIVGGQPGSVVVRVTVFDPHLDLGTPGHTAHPHVLVTKRSATTKVLPPIALQTVTYERDVPAVKHIGLFGTVYHRRQAQLSGFDDVLFVDDQGYVSEGATWNIGFIRKDQISWPDRPCLPGITMELLRRVHPGIAGPINRADLTTWDGTFITNAAVGVRPVNTIDSHHWPDNVRLVESLSKQYLEIPGDFL